MTNDDEKQIWPRTYYRISKEHPAGRLAVDLRRKHAICNAASEMNFSTMNPLRDVQIIIEQWLQHYKTSEFPSVPPTSTGKPGFDGPKANHTMQNYDIEMWRHARELKKRSDDPTIGHEHIPNSEALLQSADIRINEHGLLDPVCDQLISNKYSVNPARAFTLSRH